MNPPSSTGVRLARRLIELTMLASLPLNIRHSQAQTMHDKAPPTVVLTYAENSTVKREQLLGETDKELHKPTLSQTETRYGIKGTDLGSSFEHQGRVYFLFGDTVGSQGHALDTIATTDARDPEKGVRLDFL